MKVAVITPYYDETRDVLDRCINSVLGQTHPTDHIMIGDGVSHDFDERVQNIKLPKSHSDYGDTPRMIGSALAFSQGYDGICWLDADCWLEPKHVSTMIGYANTFKADVVTATRTLYWPDGRVLDTCMESNGQDFNDTNCYFIRRNAIFASGAWVFKDSKFSVVGDRVVWQEMQRFKRTHCVEPTVNYTSKIAVHYVERGFEPPEGARIIIQNDTEPAPQSMLYADFKKMMNNGR